MWWKNRELQINRFGGKERESGGWILFGRVLLDRPKRIMSRNQNISNLIPKEDSMTNSVDLKKCWQKAWDNFDDLSFEGQVLVHPSYHTDHADKERMRARMRRESKCPECATKLFNQQGCATCPTCGWSAC